MAINTYHVRSGVLKPTFTKVARGGVLKDATVTGKTTGGGGGGGGGGALVPAGYVLFKEWDLTQNEGWFLHTGKTISAAYYTAANVTFGPTGMRIRCTKEVTGGLQYSSGQAEWRSPAIPNYFYYRFVAKMEQSVILGDFPAFLWMRPYPSGEGEIDCHETMANHISGVTGATQASLLGNKVTLIKTPYGGSQVDVSKEIDYTKVGGTEIAGCTVNHVYEGYKTPNQYVTYVDGVLMTTHTRGSGMTGTDWDNMFERPGEVWDLRVCYQYGDDPDGQPVGNAGVPQNFAGDRYMNLSELMIAVPA